MTLIDFLSILFATTSITLIIVIITILKLRNEPKKVNIPPFNDSTTKLFLNELDKMILYYTVYNIDVTFGNTFRDKKGVSDDIENSDLLNAIDNIGKKIIGNASGIMKSYLYQYLGKEWVFDYILIQTQSIAMNYTKLNIQSLSRDLFK